MNPIPVSVARDVGDDHAKDLVVIVAWDRASGRTNVVTWGREPLDKAAAATAGERVAEVLGLVAGEATEDYRREGEAAQRVDRLARACRAADHVLGSLLAVRTGASDELLQQVRADLQAAMKVG